jgi:co-chaperonin GroES (HSP10)
MYKIPVAPSGKIYVKLDKRFNDEIITESGVRLFLDPTWRPEWNVCIHGEVVSIPHKLGNQLENNGIMPVVEVGDKVYFSYQVALKEHRLFEVVNDDGTRSQYWMVDYFHIWCAIRNGNVIMVGGKVAVEPEQEIRDEKIGSIFVPENYRKNTSKKRGTLRFIGKPLEGEPYLDVLPGDTVVFPEKCAFLNEIEGKEFYLVDQMYLDAREVRKEELDICL